MFADVVDALVSTSDFFLSGLFFVSGWSSRCLIGRKRGRKKGRAIVTYVSRGRVVVGAFLPGTRAICGGVSQGVGVVDGELDGRVASCHLMRAEIGDVEGFCAGELCSC